MSLETARTSLRRFQAGDLAFLRELEADPEVMRFTAIRVPQSEEESRARLERLLARQPELEPFGVWAAESRSGGLVGWFMIVPTEFEHPEFGFMLPRRCWGRGLATEIGQALVSHALTALGCRGLAAVADTDNAASARVLEKLGFRLVSTREKLDPKLGRVVRAGIWQR